MHSRRRHRCRRRWRQSNPKIPSRPDGHSLPFWDPFSVWCVWKMQVERPLYCRVDVPRARASNIPSLGNSWLLIICLVAIDWNFARHSLVHDCIGERIGSWHVDLECARPSETRAHAHKSRTNQVNKIETIRINHDQMQNEKRMLCTLFCALLFALYPFALSFSLGLAISINLGARQRFAWVAIYRQWAQPASAVGEVGEKSPRNTRTRVYEPENVTDRVRRNRNLCARKSMDYIVCVTHTHTMTCFMHCACMCIYRTRLAVHNTQPTPHRGVVIGTAVPENWGRAFVRICMRMSEPAEQQTVWPRPEMANSTYVHTTILLVYHASSLVCVCSRNRKHSDANSVWSYCVGR